MSWRDGTRTPSPAEEAVNDAIDEMLSELRIARQ